jgi:hypothetical protein
MRENYVALNNNKKNRIEKNEHKIMLFGRGIERISATLYVTRYRYAIIACAVVVM